MINEIDILHESHSSDFTSHTGKKAAGLLCVVSYHQEIVVELGEYSFDSFAEPLVGPDRRTPVFLIQPIRDFKRDVGYLKEILLNLGAEVALVSKHHAIIIFPAHIIKIMEVMDACGCHVIGMDYPMYPTDGMEFISIVVRALRCAITPVGSRIDIVASHGTTFGSGILADLDRFGVDAEHILAAVYGYCDILADIFGKSRRPLAPGVELPAADKVWQILLAFIVKAVKEQVLAVKAKCLGCYPKGYDLEVGKLRDNTTPGYIAKFIHPISRKILAHSEDSYEIYDEVAHMLSNSR